VRSAFVDLFLVGEIPARLQSKSPFHARMEKGLLSCAHNFTFSSPIPLPASPEPSEAFTGLVNIGIAMPRGTVQGKGFRWG